MADLIDPTVTGDYPVVLGDGLLKKDPNEIFTGVRYNHKPANSADGVNARLKPSIPGDTSSYDLVLPNKDNRPEYAYAGTRNTDDGQYVLYFDPEREAFVLDRIDSMFNMNITRVPGNTDPASLGQKYPHIGNDGKLKGSKTQNAESKPKPAVKAAPRKKEPPPQSKKQQQKQQPKQNKSTGLAFPQAPPKPKAAPPKSRSRVSEDEEEDDDDGGLLVEYPGAEPRAPKKDFSPAFQTVRRFDDFMDARESEADDADGESEMDADEFKLPSPVNNGEPEPEPDAMDVDMDDDQESEEDQGQYRNQPPAPEPGSPDLEDDLEKDMEMAFEEAAADSHRGSPPDGDESEISEED